MLTHNPLDVRRTLGRNPKSLEKGGIGAIEIDCPPNFHERGERGRLKSTTTRTSKNVRKGGRLESTYHRKNKMRERRTTPEHISGHGPPWPGIVPDCPGLPRIAPFLPRIALFGLEMTLKLTRPPPMSRAMLTVTPSNCTCKHDSSHDLLYGNFDRQNAVYHRLKPVPPTRPSKIPLMASSNQDPYILLQWRS